MKDNNRIEIVGAYYLRIIIRKHKFSSDQFYELKSSALRAAKDLSAILVLPIYDYNGEDPGWHHNAKYKIIRPCNARFKRNEFGQLKLLNDYDVAKLKKDYRIKSQDIFCGTCGP